MIHFDFFVLSIVHVEYFRLPFCSVCCRSLFSSPMRFYPKLHPWAHIYLAIPRHEFLYSLIRHTVGVVATKLLRRTLMPICSSILAMRVCHGEFSRGSIRSDTLTKIEFSVKKSRIVPELERVVNSGTNVSGWISMKPLYVAYDMNVRAIFRLIKSLFFSSWTSLQKCTSRNGWNHVDSIFLGWLFFLKILSKKSSPKIG